MRVNINLFTILFAFFLAADIAYVLWSLIDSYKGAAIVSLAERIATPVHGLHLDAVGESSRQQVLASLILVYGIGVEPAP